jgi:hypothetical protein
MKNVELITQNQQEFLKFLKAKFPVYHKSNVFLRDLEYGVIQFLSEKNIKTNYNKAETATQQVISRLEKEKILIKIDSQTWMMNYPEFTSPKVEKPAPVVAPKV